MDLQSYIQLKKQYVQMHTPQQEAVSEEVEAVEEILSEEELQENPNTWNNPFGQLSRTATKMFGNADQIKGVKKNEKDIQDREDQVFRDGGGNARQRELEKKGFLSGQARRAVMNQGDKNRAQARRQQSSSSSSSSSSSYDPRPGGGARDDLRAAQNAGNKGAKASTQGGGSSSSSQQSSSSSSTQKPASTSSSSAQTSSQPAAAAKTQPAAAPKKDNMAGASKADRMSAWAKANPKLAAAKAKRDATRGTTASSNPLMKGMGTKSPANTGLANAKKTVSNAIKSSGAAKAVAPAVNTAKKAVASAINPAKAKAPEENKKKPAPTAGAKAAMKAQQPLLNSTDMSEFDIIIEHLVEQGFPVEEALKLMVNMTEEKREQILEAAMHRDAKTGEVTDKAEIGKTYYPAQPKRKTSVALRKEKEAAEKKTQKEEVESVEEGMHREADTGKVVDKAEPGKTYYPNMPKKKSSVALRKEKEAAKKKTQKEEMQSLVDAYKAMYVSEEEADRLRDQRQERGGVDGNTRYDKAPKAPNTKKFGSGKTMAQKEMEKKYGKGASAMDIVRADLEKKYGKGAILGSKKKSDKKD